jgi:hypothetical protein
VKLTTHFRLVPSLRVTGVTCISPLPLTPSFRAQNNFKYILVFNMVNETHNILSRTITFVFSRSPTFLARIKIQAFCFTIYVYMYIYTYTYSVVCLTTGPSPLPKPVLHRVQSTASSLNFRYPLLRSSSRCVLLLPHLPITSILPSTFPSATCFRRQFLRKIRPIQLSFLLIYIYTHTHIHIYVYKHTHIHTYIHTYIYRV